MRIEKCYFCSKPIYPGHGMVFARNDAKLFRFCSSKCHKHFKAKHNPRKMRWTKAYRKTHGKEMIVDSVFEFEKKRDEPLVYNRNLVIKTIQAMKRIQKIKERREHDFWLNRMNVAKEKSKGRLEREIARDITLVEPKDKERVKQLIEKATVVESNTENLTNKRRNKKGADGVDMELE